MDKIQPNSLHGIGDPTKFYSLIPEEIKKDKGAFLDFVEKAIGPDFDSQHVAVIKAYVFERWIREWA